VVLARDLPATREILQTFKSVKGVFLFESDAEIPQLLERAMAVDRSAVDDSLCEDWQGWGAGFMDFCATLLKSDALFSIAEGRITAGDWLRAGWSQVSSVVVPMPRMHFLPPLPLAVDANSDAAEDGAKSRYGLVEILTLPDDSAFLRAAYLHILKRPIDNDGMGHFTKLLSAGLHRLDIAEQLAGSQEAQDSGRGPQRLQEIAAVRAQTH
jgi:hypothetical protein